MLFLGAFWIEIIHYGVILSVLGAFFIVRRSIHQKNRAARHYQRNRLTAEIQRRRRNFFGVFFWITCKSKKKNTALIYEAYFDKISPAALTITYIQYR